ncbi:hypothetical protein ACQPTN_24800 [Bradyrhizobium sp. 13971]
MTSAQDGLRKLVNFLEWLTEQPSHLPETKLNREKLVALALVVRGWKRLAGETTEDVEALANEVGAGVRVLLENRKEAGPGRKWESRERALVELDRAVLADIRAGMTQDAAIRKTYGEGRDFEANKTRIKRLRREEKITISLQTPDNEGH